MTLACVDYLLRKGDYRDNSHIIHIASSTHNKQQACNKNICSKERGGGGGGGGEVMTAKHMCSNFGSK